MNKYCFLLIAFLFCSGLAKSQTLPTTSAFGEIDTADLKLTSCSFEKDANAMVLFDKAEVSSGLDSVVMLRHKRIKLFQGYPDDLATVKLPFYSRHGYEQFLDLQAQTITLENNKIVITKVDPKLIYTQTIDKNFKAFVFTFPGVKAGSVIEYRYRWKCVSPAAFPDWYFQNTIPTRYSEITTNILYKTLYRIITKGYDPFIKKTEDPIPNSNGDGNMGTKNVWAKANIHSLVMEPFITPGNMNFQSIVFRLHSISTGYSVHQLSDNWLKIAMDLMFDVDFGQQLDQKLNQQDALINKANTLKSDDEKIAFLFSEIKQRLKWNGVNHWYTDDGVKSAWNKKNGNSTEINLALYNLLKKACLTAYPMVVSTRDNGTINPVYASYGQINKTVIYIPVDSVKNYVLDATSKYNTYNEIPQELLNTYGIKISRIKDTIKSEAIFLKNNKPAWQIILINADIKPDSKVTGTAEISNYSYNKSAFRQIYELLGESKYIELLGANDYRLKITGLETKNTGIDSLPMVHHLNFVFNLNSADDNYIYFTPNLFSPLKINPFLKEERFSDIDFGNCTGYNITGTYKLPPGYKIDALPKNTLLSVKDKSILFKRLVQDNDGAIEMNYTITFKRSIYSVGEYPALRDFYKKMFDMLNEPIVLKKSL